MFRRSASIVALCGAGLLAAAPFAAADPVVIDDDSDSGVNLLNDLTVLPVQACGVEASIPILSGILSPSDSAAPDATCAVVDDAEDDVED